MMIGESAADPVPAIPLPDKVSIPVPEPGLPKAVAEEIGGRDGLDPTRYGDWEKNGRCIDF